MAEHKDQETEHEEDNADIKQHDGRLPNVMLQEAFLPLSGSIVFAAGHDQAEPLQAVIET
jgi:hypothetical protein